MAFPCSNVRCAVNREGMCLSAFVAKPDDCDDYLEVKTENTQTRTELTANEKIALELVNAWSTINYDCDSTLAGTVLDTYKYFRDKLNEEDGETC